LVDAAAICSTVATAGSNVTVAVFVSKSTSTVVTPLTEAIAALTVMGQVLHVI